MGCHAGVLRNKRGDHQGQALQVVVDSLEEFAEAVQCVWVFCTPAKELRELGGDVPCGSARNLTPDSLGHTHKELARIMGGSIGGAWDDRRMWIRVVIRVHVL